MFPSIEIFLMRVPSELVAGDGQLLLGGVAIPGLVVAPRALLREGWGGHRRPDRRCRRTYPDLQAGLRPDVGSPTGDSPDLILARRGNGRQGRACGGAARSAGKSRPTLYAARNVASLSPRLYPAVAGAAECAPGTSGHAGAEGGAALATARLSRDAGAGLGAGLGLVPQCCGNQRRTPPGRRAPEVGGRPRSKGVACSRHLEWAGLA